MGKFLKKFRCDAGSRTVGERLGNTQSASMEELSTTKPKEQVKVSSAPTTRKAEKILKNKKKCRSKFLPSPKENKKYVKSESTQTDRDKIDHDQLCTAPDKYQGLKLQSQNSKENRSPCLKSRVSLRSSDISNPKSDESDRKSENETWCKGDESKMVVSKDDGLTSLMDECKVTGDGLTEALKNKRAAFFIHSTLVDILYLHVTISDDEGHDIPVEFKCEKEFVHEVSYSPRKRGSCSICVTWRGKHVTGSPFLVSVGGA